jgi:histidine ammonia-lyase
VALRGIVPALGSDRYMAPDIEAAAGMMRDGVLLPVAGLGDFRLGEAA